MHNFRKATIAAATAASVALGSTAVAVAQENTPDLGTETAVTKDAFFKNFGENPLWAQLLFVGGIATMVSAVVGLIVAPLYNYVVHGM